MRLRKYKYILVVNTLLKLLSPFNKKIFKKVKSEKERASVLFLWGYYTSLQGHLNSVSFQTR